MKLVELGHCGRPHGIKGGFVFNLFNVEDSVLEVGSLVHLTPSDSSSSIPADGADYTISKISFGNKVVVYLEGVTDRNVVESMTPFTVSVDRSVFPQTDDSEFYVTDLLGMTACDYSDQKVIGEIFDFYENNAQVVLVVKLKSGEMIDIPFIESFFPEVDLEDNKVYVVLPQEV